MLYNYYYYRSTMTTTYLLVSWTHLCIVRDTSHPTDLLPAPLRDPQRIVSDNLYSSNEYFYNNILSVWFEELHPETALSATGNRGRRPGVPCRGNYQSSGEELLLNLWLYNIEYINRVIYWGIRRIITIIFEWASIIIIIPNNIHYNTYFSPIG